MLFRIIYDNIYNHMDLQGENIAGLFIEQSPFTPLNIYNGTTKGCPTRDLRATVTDKSIK